MNPGAHLLAGGRAKVALDINNITEEEVLRSPPVVLVRGWLQNLLHHIASEQQDEPLTLLAYNKDFDIAFLSDGDWAAIKLDTLSWECAMVRTMRVLNQTRWPKLVNACAQFDIQPLPGQQAHRAAADAILALRLWYAAGLREDVDRAGKGPPHPIFQR